MLKHLDRLVILCFYCGIGLITISSGHILHDHISDSMIKLISVTTVVGYMMRYFVLWCDKTLKKELYNA